MLVDGSPLFLLRTEEVLAPLKLGVYNVVANDVNILDRLLEAGWLGVLAVLDHVEVVDPRVLLLAQVLLDLLRLVKAGRLRFD